MLQLSGGRKHEIQPKHGKADPRPGASNNDSPDQAKTDYCRQAVVYTVQTAACVLVY